MLIRRRNPDQTHQLAGPASVDQVLHRLAINPETVLVIHGGELVTKDVVLPDDAEVEIRSVISGGAGPASCHACETTAVIEISSNHAAYCARHFIDHVRSQVRRAIDQHGMMSYSERILVAVSGGKDSLGLWDVLLDMGYRVDGLYLGLGIGDYSDRSGEIVHRFASRRAARLHKVELAEAYGYSIPDTTGVRSRSACGTCGLSKRYVFNRVAVEHGYDVMATGHNLDDEAATLFGNVLRWQTPFMARQSPALPAHDNQARKVKPLYRLSEREMAAYCVIKGLDYVVEECPLVGGNTALRYKSALNDLERESPGTKAAFLFGYLDRVREAHFAAADEAQAGLVRCVQCDMLTTPPRGRSANADPVCAFCRSRRRVLAARQRNAH